jgi:hypothetical protein
MSRPLFERLLHKHTSPVEETQELEAEAKVTDLKDTPDTHSAAVIEGDLSELEQAEIEFSHDVAKRDETSDEEASDDSSSGNAMSKLLASKASPELKKRALRSLFFSGQFSEVDPLNDYQQDFSQVKTLSSEIADTLRRWSIEKIEEIEDEVLNSEPALVDEPVLALDNDPLKESGSDGLSAQEEQLVVKSNRSSVSKS